MSEGAGSRKQLGKIMLQQKLVTADELGGMLDDQAKRGGRLGGAAVRDGKLAVPEALRLLSEQHGVPGLDLGRQVVPLSNLMLVPIEMAREHVVLPVRVQGEQLILAMASPQNETSVEELQFVTAKTVFPHIALEQALRLAIEEAYALQDEGHPYWVGERVTDEELVELSITRPPRVQVELTEIASPNADPSEAGRGTGPAAGHEGDLGAEEALSGVVHGRPDTVSGGPELDQAFSERPRVSPSQEPKAYYGDKKVLVVDDDEDIRRLIRLTLEQAAIPVLEAGDGTRALEMIRDELPDVILLDAVLPGVHGFDICRRLRGSQRYGSIPIVIVSAIHRGWRVAEDLRETYGIEHLFDKPIDLQRLSRTVQALLEGGTGAIDESQLSIAAQVELENGMQAFERGSLDEAISHLRAGVQIDPLAFELQYHLGLLYGRRENLFSAIETLETAIGLSPRNFSALKNLAVVYQRAGFRHKSLEVWQRATANAPDEETRVHIKEHMVTLL